MGSKKIIRAGLLVSVLAISLPGCNGQDTATADSHVEQSNQVQANPAKNKTGLNIEAQYRKPGADIHLINSAVPLLTPGQVKAIELVLRVGYREGVITVSINPTEGLEVVGGSVTLESPLSDNQDYKLPLQVIAYEAGRYYLNITVTVQMPDGATASRVMGFAVQAGNIKGGIESTGSKATIEEVTTAGKAAAENSGVVSMPAEEAVY